MVTAAPADPSLLVTLGVGALIAWRMYARVRRSLVRQRLTSVRPWITVAIFPSVVAALFASPVVRGASAASLGAAFVVGIALGLWAVRHTKFETTPDGLFYTPSAPFGIALSALLVVRVLYRLAHGYAAMQGFAPTQGFASAQAFASAQGGLPAGAAPPMIAAGSPITLAILGAVAGYYAAYSAGLIRWRLRSSARA